jgi:hypothetical protein
VHVTQIALARGLAAIPGQAGRRGPAMIHPKLTIHCQAVRLG